MTGADGFVGRHLVQRLRQAGHEVAAGCRPGGAPVAWGDDRVTSIPLELTDDDLRMVATDGHRLAFVSVTRPKGGGGNVSAIVPKKTLLEILKILGEGESEVESHDKCRILLGLFDQVLSHFPPASPCLQSHYLAVPHLRKPDLLRRAGDRS